MRATRRSLIAGAVATCVPLALLEADRAPNSAALVAVRVFPSFGSTVYDNHEAVLGRLGQLGVKRMSTLIAADTGAEVVTFIQRAYSEHGIKVWLTVGKPREVLEAAEWQNIQDTIIGPLAGMVEMVSGWNEPNNVVGGGAVPADWAQTSVAHNKELYRRFAHLVPKVGTPQLWSGDLAIHQADMLKVKKAGIAGTFNTITWHLYPRGTVGTRLLDDFEALYRREWSATAQIIATEAGYIDAVNYSGGAPPNVSPAQKARLVPLLIDSYVSRGYGVSYYELLDDPDPTEADRESNFGLVECPGRDPATWSNKPAFDTLRTYLAAHEQANP